MDQYSKSGTFGEVRIGPDYRISQKYRALDKITQCGWHHVNDGYCVEREHGADSHLLIFTMRGEGCVMENGDRYSAVANTVCIIPKATPCRYFVPQSGDWEFTWIHCVGDNADAMIADMLALSSPKIPLPYSSLKQHFDLLLSSDNKGSKGEIFAASTLSDIFFAILRAINDAPPKKEERDVVLTLLRDIEANYNKPFHLDEISKKYYLSKEYLIRLFKKQTGKTPYAYHRYCKIPKAANDLIYTDQTIFEIAKAIGYTNEISFSIQFKKEFSVSPSEYRRQNKVYHN